MLNSGKFKNFSPIYDFIKLRTAGITNSEEKTLIKTSHYIIEHVSGSLYGAGRVDASSDRSLVVIGSAGALMNAFHSSTCSITCYGSVDKNGSVAAWHTVFHS